MLALDAIMTSIYAFTSHGGSTDSCAFPFLVGRLRGIIASFAFGHCKTITVASIEDKSKGREQEANRGFRPLYAALG